MRSAPLASKALAAIASIKRLRPSTASAGPYVALAGLLLACVGLRLTILITSTGRLDGDEGVTGVMAQRIMDGDFPVFFGVQNYQGALEQYLQAAWLMLAPDNPLTLRMVQLALSIAVVVVTFLVARRVTSSPWGGVLAAALIAIAPYYWLWKGIKSHGGYNAALLGGMCALALAFAIRRGGPRARSLFLLLGLASGIALWSNFIAVYLVIPAILWSLGSARGRLARLVPWGAAGFIAGLAPLIAFYATHGVMAPTRSADQPATSYVDRLKGLFDPVLPEFLGLGGADARFDFGLPRTAVTWFALAALAWGLWVRRRGLRDLLLLRTGGRRPIDAVLLAVGIAPFIYAASPFTWMTGEPRYLLTLYPAAAVLVAAGVHAVRVPEFRAAMAVGLIIVSGFLSTMTMQRWIELGGPLSGARTGSFPTEELPNVVDALDDLGVSSAYANYWIAGPLQFASGNRIRVGAGYWSQFPAIEEAIRRDRRAAIVVPTQPGAEMIATTLKGSKRRFRQTQVGSFTIFSHILPAWRPPPTSDLFWPA